VGRGGGYCTKISVCAQKLRDWGDVKFKGKRKKMEKIEKDLKKLMKKEPSRNVISIIKVLETELDTLLEEEEIYWQQQSNAH